MQKRLDELKRPSYLHSLKLETMDMGAATPLVSVSAQADQVFTNAALCTCQLREVSKGAVKLDAPVLRRVCVQPTIHQAHNLVVIGALFAYRMCVL